MTKSPRRLAREALRVAEPALPAYSCPTSRKHLTQPQFGAAPALKTFLRTDYRGAAAFLQDFPELRRDLGLTKGPPPPPSATPSNGSCQKGVPPPPAGGLPPRP
jgi:hypothetical protein